MPARESTQHPSADGRHWVGRHPLVFIGAILSLGSVFLLLFVLGLSTFIGIAETLSGLLIDVTLVLLLALGLLFIAVGGWSYRGASRQPPRWVIDWSVPRDRATFFAAIVIALLGVFAVVGATHLGISYMDRTTFCADVCHEVMAPAALPHALSPHANVTCAECHIAPGVGGYLQAKMKGASETWHQLRNDYARPLIVSDLTSVPDPGVCSRCHPVERPYGSVDKTFPSFAADEKNTPSPTRLTLRLGSPASGIHHHIAMNIRYFSTDGGRTVQQVVLTRPDGSKVEFAASGTPPAPGAKGVWRKVTCITCHNRTGHEVMSFERRVDEAMAVGALPAADPGLKKRLMEAAGPQEKVPAEAEYRESLRKLAAVAQADPRLAEPGARETVTRLFAASVFPSMKVGPTTYPNYLGHEGCFRCHGPMGQISGSPEPPPPNDCSFCHTLH